ncbi:ATPase [Luteimonas padinae]|nr:ATPase [Luteimonas padinae]
MTRAGLPRALGARLQRPGAAAALAARGTGVAGPSEDGRGGHSEGVAPTLAELIALRGLAHARGGVRRGASGVRAQAPSMLRGRGMEYAESRGYAIGDDARHIDWRVTARTGKPHTKLFQAERERTTLLVCDTAPALYFGTRVRFKSVQAARAGAVAAWRAVAEGDRIAALRGSRAAPPVPAASGARGALRVLDALAQWYARPVDDDAGLEAALGQARRLLRPGSRLLVLADPASVAAIPDERWPALAAHHQVDVLLLTDPLETEPPSGLFGFAPAAPGGDIARRVDLDLADPAQRRRWQEAFANQVSTTISALAARGVRAIALPCNAPSDAWLAAPGAGRR